MPVRIMVSYLQIYLGLDHIYILCVNISLPSLYFIKYHENKPQKHFAFKHVSRYRSSSHPHSTPSLYKLWCVFNTVISVNDTPTVRNAQVGFGMVAAGYGLRQVFIVDGSRSYVSRGTTEYGGFLLVTFEATNMFRL